MFNEVLNLFEGLGLGSPRGLFSPLPGRPRKVRIGTKATKARAYREGQRREAKRRQRTDKPEKAGRHVR